MDDPTSRNDPQKRCQLMDCTKNKKNKNTQYRRERERFLHIRQHYWIFPASFKRRLFSRGALLQLSVCVAGGGTPTLSTCEASATSRQKLLEIRVCVITPVSSFTFQRFPLPFNIIPRTHRRRDTRTHAHKVIKLCSLYVHPHRSCRVAPDALLQAPGKGT